MVKGLLKGLIFGVLAAALLWAAAALRLDAVRRGPGPSKEPPVILAQAGPERAVLALPAAPDGLRPGPAPRIWRFVPPLPGAGRAQPVPILAPVWQSDRIYAQENLRAQLEFGQPHGPAAPDWAAPAAGRPGATPVVRPDGASGLDPLPEAEAPFLGARPPELGPAPQFAPEQLAVAPLSPVWDTGSGPTPDPSQTVTPPEPPAPLAQPKDLQASGAGGAPAALALSAGPEPTPGTPALAQSGAVAPQGSVAGPVPDPAQGAEQARPAPQGLAQGPETLPPIPGGLSRPPETPPGTAPQAQPEGAAEEPMLALVLATERMPAGLPSWAQSLALPQAALRGAPAQGPEILAIIPADAAPADIAALGDLRARQGAQGPLLIAGALPVASKAALMGLAQQSAAGVIAAGPARALLPSLRAAGVAAAPSYPLAALPQALERAQIQAMRGGAAILVLPDSPETRAAVADWKAGAGAGLRLVSASAALERLSP